MAISKDIKELGDAIVRTHDGKMFFSLSETGKITGDSITVIGRRLHENGITVKKVGPRKMLHAYQIAEYMHKNHVSPIDGRQ